MKNVVEHLLEEISALSPGELAELIQAIEKEFSVSAGIPAAKPKRKPKFEDGITEPSIKIRLLDAGTEQVKVKMFLRRTLGLNLSEMREKFENLPATIYHEFVDMTLFQAEARMEPWLKELRALGAEAEWEYDYGSYD